MSPSSGQLQLANHSSLLHFLVLKVTHPIVMMASLFWQLLVQIDILSPLGLTLTTAPQTSSLASSNDSPTKHKSYKPHKAKLEVQPWGKTYGFLGFCLAAYGLHPIAIKVIVSLLPIESYQPSTSQLVPVILPHWFDTILWHKMTK